MRRSYLYSERWIPTGSTPVTREGVNGIVYDTSTADKFSAIGYSGKRNKPDFNFRFRTAEQKDAHIQKFFDGLEASAKYKEERKQERSKPHTYEVGDILFGSWGYEQTNTEFWQVIETTPYTVTIQEVSQKSVEGSEGFMSDRRLPIKDSFIGKPKKCRANSYGGVKVHECCHVYKWDGQSKMCSWYG